VTSQTDTTAEASSSTTTPDDQTPPSTASQPKKPVTRKPRKRTAPADAEDGADDAQEGDEDADVNPLKKRRGRKAAGTAPAKQRQRRSATAGASPDGNTEGTATPRRRARSVTPEDAEYQQVDLSSMTMADLTKDLRIGKKSRVHDMLLAREREKIAALKLKKAGLTSDTDSAAATPAPTEGETNPRNRFLDMDMSASEPTGLQYTMIGGQIVVDQSSLSLDRHERARQQQLASGAITAEMEEDDFTNHITETSFRTGSKLRGPNYWNEDDTELFYRGIGMLGTDFTLICKMFPGRNRRHVKMKFNREERLNPVRINSVLTGKKSMSLDIDEYKHWTKSEYEPVADIMAAYQAKEAEFKEKARLLEQEKEEANRKKKEALFADDEGGEGDGADAAEGGKKKKTKRKKKNNGDDGMWGEIVEETLVEA
jgi:transcription factor TFIIIB component B''